MHGEYALAKGDSRMELDIRDILVQMGIPSEKWPTDLIKPENEED